jgi:hypothetical protein
MKPIFRKRGIDRSYGIWAFFCHWESILGMGRDQNMIFYFSDVPSRKRSPTQILSHIFYVGNQKSASITHFVICLPQVSHTLEKNGTCDDLIPVGIYVNTRLRECIVKMVTTTLITDTVYCILNFLNNV